MRSKPSLFAALTVALAICPDAFAGSEWSGGSHYAGGGHWGSGRGFVRGPSGVWRYYGPAYPSPDYSGDTPFMDCYAYDAGQRHWVRIC
jgi:hypothetical protein